MKNATLGFKYHCRRDIMRCIGDLRASVNCGMFLWAAAAAGEVKEAG